MRALISKGQAYCQFAFSILALAMLLATPATLAQSGRDKVDGVKNFGRITNRYFRGGAITSDGIDNLAKMGVRTIIDLRDKPNADEPKSCAQLGIKYYNFPMSGHDTPDDRAVNKILSIIQNAKEPVYVHCSAGKHRAGTIAALYRTRMQGWSKDRAWAEQQSYGFGSADGHPQLYSYVYGRNTRSGNNKMIAAESSDADKPSKKSKKIDDDEQSLKNDDDDQDKPSKSKKGKEEKLSKSKKKDYDDDDDDYVKKEKKHKKKGKDKDAEVTWFESEPVNEPAEDLAPRPTATIAGLSESVEYIALSEAVSRALDEGGSGDLLQLNLEWDQMRAVPTWDVTFASGVKYEIDALTGKLLGTKPKAQAKLAMLSPLSPNERGRLTFRQVLRKAAASQGQAVVEIELKQLKGRNEMIYEVELADGSSLFFDAATGETISGM